MFLLSLTLRRDQGSLSWGDDTGTHLTGKRKTDWNKETLGNMKAKSQKPSRVGKGNELNVT